MSTSDEVIGSISETSNFGEFEWRISNCSEKIFQVENGHSLSSPTFSFSSCSWYLTIFPNGENSSRKEYISLFLNKRESDFEKYMFWFLDMTVQGIQFHKLALASLFGKNESSWGVDCELRKKMFGYWSKETKSCCELTIKVRLKDPVIYMEEDDALLKLREKDRCILSQDFEEMLLGRDDHDIVLKVKDKEFKAHGIILQVRCPAFKSMLASEILERNRGIIEIPDCDPLAFEQFIFYIYTGELKLLDESIMLGLYIIAHKYNMENLKEKCCMFIKKSLSVDVVCSVIKLALNHSDTALLAFATKYLINNAKEIFVTEAWQSFIEENPIQAKELTVKVVNNDSHCCVLRSDDDLDKKNNKMCQNYKDLLLCGDGYDLLLKVKESEFKAHRNIMHCRCPVFKSMLTHEMLEKSSGVVEIPDCDPRAFEQFLFYIYTGDLETLNESIMLGLYYIADKYDMADLKEKCCDFIKKSLSTHNVADVIRLALNHSNTFLLEFATEYFAINVEEILITVGWQCFIKENPIQANELFMKAISKYKSHVSTKRINQNNST